MEIQRLAVGEVERFRTIRLRALAEAPRAFGTRREDAVAWAPEAWSELFSGLTLFVAVVDGHDVGLVRGAAETGAERAARLGSLWVAPEARGTGAGTSLINAVIDWAKSEGFTELILDVTDDNRWAVALYARMGFERTGEVGTLPAPRDHITQHQRARRL